jgi:D-threo-aldose 1-dehydrogenase
MSQRVTLPKVIFGTSVLGNLYVALDDKVKLEVFTACIQYISVQKAVVFDCAGKYGAGLALESMGNCLKTLNVNPENVLISNKLGWYITNELQNCMEPTFESGVWRNLKYDAVQKISYEGILECYEQDNQLLNGYKAELVSVHDPDEYMVMYQNLEKTKSRKQKSRK